MDICIILNQNVESVGIPTSGSILFMKSILLNYLSLLLPLLGVFCSLADYPVSGAESPDQLWNVYKGTPDLPGSGKTVVLISGDEEYRSEEACSQLGKILAVRHGFTCIVLYAIDSKTGEINPLVLDNIPGMENLADADVCLLNLRFRNLPDDQMEPFVDYLKAGKPIIGLRTSTHAFNIPPNRKYSPFSFQSSPTRGSKSNDDSSETVQTVQTIKTVEPPKETKAAPFQDWEQGFGRQILGETWIAHYGSHGKQGTRGVIAENQKNHPIVRGCEDIFGPTDVYRVRTPLPGDSVPLVYGLITDDLTPQSAPAAAFENDPPMPIAWTRTYQSPVQPERVGRVFTTTMGAAVDLESEGVRRLLVNAVYWAAGLEAKIPPRADVALVGDYKPSWFGYGKQIPGKKPADYRLQEAPPIRRENPR